MKYSILQNLSAECPWRDTLHWYDTIDSTNTQAKKLVRQGVPHGTILIAGQQTGGRGRMGRSFHSPQGLGIYLSLILRPNCPPSALMHLTCAAAVAMCDAVEETTGSRPGIKWINDLVLENKKLGGILTELSLDSKTGLVDYAVIGIGINCRHSLADFPPQLHEIATSLSLCALPADPAVLAAAMVESLHRMDAALLTGKAGIMARYRKDCLTIGRKVIVHRPDSQRRATAVSVDDDGALVVTYADGTTEAVNSGEVSVRGMYSYI